MTDAKHEILLVEDNESDIELTTRALRNDQLNYELRVARDGEEALLFLSERVKQVAAGLAVMPQLILLDLKLPKIDGFELLEHLKSNPDTQCIPVVVLSSSRHDTDVVRCYRLGANSYLQKAIDFAEFREMINRLGAYWLLANLVPSPIAIRVYPK